MILTLKEAMHWFARTNATKRQEMRTTKEYVERCAEADEAAGKVLLAEVWRLRRKVDAVKIAAAKDYVASHAVRWI